MLCRVIRDARGNITGTPRRDHFIEAKQPLRRRAGGGRQVVSAK
jgi:hypothetical protein